MRKSLQSIFIVLLTAVVFMSSCQKEAVQDNTPLAATIKILSDVTATTAISGGVSPYYATAKSSVTANGVCWSSTNQTPTTADSKTSDTLAVSYYSKLTGLTPNTTYYLRAYVTTVDGGTGYGGTISFKTPTATASTTATVSTLAGSSTGAFGDSNGTGGSVLFNGPLAISYNSVKNSFYISDSYNNIIRTLSPVGVSDNLTNPTLGYLEGPLTTAQFYGIRGTATDATGNTYVADAGNNVIRKISSTGTVSTFAGNGTAGYADGTGAIVKFNNPQGVALDATGNVYVADRNNNIIRKITPAGAVSTLAGLTTPGFVDGTGTAATFNQPVALAVDATGNVYVADYKNVAIRKITPTGDVTTLGGGPNYPKLIGAPAGLAIDAAGNLFIADQNGRILKLVNNNMLNVIAGSYGAAGNVNGVGTVARFSSPQGITFDNAGNLYVTDFGNNAIRKISIVNVP